MPRASSLSLGGAALFAVVFLVSVSGLGGAAAVYHATGTGLMAATWLGALTCTAPFAGAGLVMYSLVAVAREPTPTALTVLLWTCRWLRVARLTSTGCARS